MRGDTTADKFDREQWTNELSPILNLWKKLNQVSDVYVQGNIHKTICTYVRTINLPMITR